MRAARSTQHEPLVERLLKGHPGYTPEQAIEAFVEKILAEGNQLKLPVHVEMLASLIGIRCREGDFAFAGRIRADESGQLVMELNGDDAVARKRFTYAHEIIHTAFPGFSRESRYRMDMDTGRHNPSRSEEEYLCDYGAALMLMPRGSVEGRYDIGGGLRHVERLAADARVSLEAAGNRLVALASRPAAFLVLELGHKPADMPALRRGADVEPQLRVRYGTLQHVHGFIPRFKSVSPDSVFGRALLDLGIAKGHECLPGVGDAAFDVEAKLYPWTDSERVVNRVLATAVTN